MSNLLLLSLIGVTGLLCQWLAWRIKLPAILFLLLAGITLGPALGVLQPDELFGDLLFPFVSLSVAIILFEGSLTLRRSELQDVESVVRKMVTYGALVNGAITTLATNYFTELGWALSALFGAIMVVTGPTVIMPMLRTVRPNARIARTLRWEGIIIDPLGALLAVLVFEWIVAQQSTTEMSHVVIVFGQAIAVGFLLGAVVAQLFGMLLRRRLIPAYLQNFFAIASVTGTFALSNTLVHESGLLAVTVMGIWLANMQGVHTRDILNFKESLTLILVSALFIILSARLDISAVIALGWGAVAVLLTMQFVARPVKVFLSTYGSVFTRNERLLLSWVGPRGIVAAAISAVFALKLENLGVVNADLLVPLAFTVIIGTVILQSATAKYVADKLGVSEPDTSGFLIIGANAVAIKIATALKSAEIHTVVCDTNWRNISAARMANLNTYYGNVMSAHAEMHLDFTSCGGMLGLSADPASNTAAAMRFRDEFGIEKIFLLPSYEDERQHEKYRVSDFYKGSVLFGAGWNYAKLYEFIVLRGAEIKSTKIRENYPFSQWKKDNPLSSALVLFVLDAERGFLWAQEGTDHNPGEGSTVYSLSLPAET